LNQLAMFPQGGRGLVHGTELAFIFLKFFSGAGD
jgi:hypothetical protein